MITDIPFVTYSFGDGVTYPVRSVDEAHDSLLGQRQRWMEEGDVDGSGKEDIGTALQMKHYKATPQCTSPL